MWLATGVLAAGVAVLAAFEPTRERLGVGVDDPQAAAAQEAPRVDAVGRLGSALAVRSTELRLRDAHRALSEVRERGESPIALVMTATPLRAEPNGEAVAELGVETEFGSPTVLSVVGRNHEWLEVRAPQLDNDETGWVHAADLDVGGIDYELRADLTARTLEVLRGGDAVRRMPVAIGGPATPTPTGTFAVTDKLELPEAGSVYGCCALAFSGRQPNVPQDWPGGDRLAVHGTPDGATIGEAASLGCLRASEADMRWLVDNVPLGTPVTISSG